MISWFETLQENWFLMVILLFILIYVPFRFYIDTKIPEDKTEVVQEDLDLTVEELAKYNGVDEKRILISVKNAIFDVTDSPFYQPNGGYYIFAGKEASVSLAKMSFNQEDLNQLDFSVLNEEQQVTLNEWYERFISKYPRVGTLKKSQNKESISQVKQ